METLLLAVVLWVIAYIVGVSIILLLGKVLGFSREVPTKVKDFPSSSDDPIEKVQRSGHQVRQAIDDLAQEFLRKVHVDIRR